MYQKKDFDSSITSNSCETLYQLCEGSYDIDISSIDTSLRWGPFYFTSWVFSLKKDTEKQE